jgi:hypothetical protein
VPRWLRPKSESLEEFVLWVLRVLILIAVMIFALRYAVGADVSTAPWSAMLRLGWR